MIGGSGQMVGGFLMVSAGAVSSETGFGLLLIPVGGAVFVRGGDVYTTGWNQLVTGQVQTSASEQLLVQAGLSHAAARPALFYFDLGSSVAGPFAAERVLLSTETALSRGSSVLYYADGLAGGGASAGEVATFYHGTSAEYASAIRAQGINLTAGESYADFGRGFYLTTSKEEALLSASRNYSGPLDVVEFSVPTQQLGNLSKLEFGSATGAWQDFVGFHKAYSPEILVHAGQPYDLVTGPLFRRYSGGVPIPWETRLPQTSIHTPEAVDLFNFYMKRN